jgi:hypothetical protein
MKTIVKKKNAAPQTSPSEEQAATEKLSEYKNLSSKPFPDPKAGTQPCLSHVCTLSVPVLRAQAEVKDTKESPRVLPPLRSQEDQFRIDAILTLRKDVIKNLTVLTRCDNGLSIQCAQMCCDLINELSRSEVPT